MESIKRESSRLSKASVGSRGGASTISGTGHNASSRPTLLSKAYNTVSHRGSRLGRQVSVGGSKLVFGGSEDDSSTATTATPQPDLHSFSGVFPVPEPGCHPMEPVPLTPEQEKMYDATLQYFKELKDYPNSLKVDDKSRAPLTEWETLRLLSRESILRYLRATKWDEKAAQKRLIDTIAWRREFGVDGLDPDEMAKEAKSGKETVLGFDNRCRPLHYMHPHRNDTKESPRQMQFAVWILERCIDMMPPGVEQLALLINFEHRSRNPTSIANAKLMLYILQNHYVERLGIALCINVPWVFKMFWNAIQAFIDPVTKSKCRFDEAVKSEVPLSQLSAEFGGQLDASYKHDAYWPDLVHTAEMRRKEMLRRFKEHCNGEIGASEWVIRGGDDPDSLFNKKDVSATADGVGSQTSADTPAGAGSSLLTTTDTSSVAAPQPLSSAATGLHDSTPLERFKTPSESLNANPIERTFSTTSDSKGDSKTNATGAATAGAVALGTTTEQPVEEEEAASKKTIEETIEEPNATQQPPATPPHNKRHSQMNHMFKEMDRKLHTSKLFAAFHPDAHRSGKQSREHSRSNPPHLQSSTPSVDDVVATNEDVASEEPVSSPRSETMPAAHEVVALAGTAGPASAAGAVTSAVSDQARTGLQRAQSTASAGLARFTSPQAEVVAGEDGDKRTTTTTETQGGKATAASKSSITVLFFAAAMEAVGGKRKHNIVLPQETATTGMPLSALGEHLLQTLTRDPPAPSFDGTALRKVLAQSKWSIDETMVDDDELERTLLHGGEDVAIIPPVSGG